MNAVKKRKITLGESLHFSVLSSTCVPTKLRWTDSIALSALMNFDDITHLGLSKKQNPGSAFMIMAYSSCCNCVGWNLYST